MSIGTSPYPRGNVCISISTMIAAAAAAAMVVMNAERVCAAGGAAPSRLRSNNPAAAQASVAASRLRSNNPAAAQASVAVPRPAPPGAALQRRLRFAPPRRAATAPCRRTPPRASTRLQLPNETPNVPTHAGETCYLLPPPHSRVRQGGRGRGGSARPTDPAAVKKLSMASSPTTSLTPAAGHGGLTAAI